jgi:DNA excision repair protein ERCC-6-like
MAYTMQRKETKILPSSQLDTVMSYHRKPVMHVESESDNMISAADITDLKLPDELKSRMFAHQIEGVQWLYGLHYSHPGGILGDDMGLGKTFQVNCLITGLMRTNKIQRVLIIAPVSVLPSWNRELVQHLAPYVKRVGIEMCSAEMTKKKRQKILADVFACRNPKVVISSYHLVANMTDEFVGGGSWDYVILDEGHIIKNPTTKLSKVMHMLKSNHRYVFFKSFSDDFD